MVIGKMWSEQQGFERWSWLHTHTHDYAFCLICTTIIVLSHQHTHTHNILVCHTNRSHKTTVLLAQTTSHNSYNVNTQGHFVQKPFTLTKASAATYLDTSAHLLTKTYRLVYSIWLALTHIDKHTHEHTYSDKWWYGVGCSRWTLSKLTSGFRRINHLIKSRQDHTNKLHTKKMRQITVICSAVHTWGARFY